MASISVSSTSSGAVLPFSPASALQPGPNASVRSHHPPAMQRDTSRVEAGRQSQSIDPFFETSAAVSVSPMTA